MVTKTAQYRGPIPQDDYHMHAPSLFECKNKKKIRTEQKIVSSSGVAFEIEVEVLWSGASADGYSTVVCNGMRSRPRYAPARC